MFRGMVCSPSHDSPRTSGGSRRTGTPSATGFVKAAQPQNMTHARSAAIGSRRNPALEAKNVQHLALRFCMSTALKSPRIFPLASPLRRGDLCPVMSVAALVDLHVLDHGADPRLRFWVLQRRYKLAPIT